MQGGACQGWSGTGLQLKGDVWSRRHSDDGCIWLPLGGHKRRAAQAARLRSDVGQLCMFHERCTMGARWRPSGAGACVRRDAAGCGSS